MLYNYRARLRHKNGALQNVLIASSGEDAMDVLKRDDVELVLTDKRLPGMDGVDLVRRVKADHPDVAVVVMTAYGTIGSAVEAMRVGAEDYLVKPFEASEVLMVARRAIEFQDLKAARRATLRRNQERFTLRNIVAPSAPMQEMFELVRREVTKTGYEGMLAAGAGLWPVHARGHVFDHNFLLFLLLPLQ